MTTAGAAGRAVLGVALLAGTAASLAMLTGATRWAVAPVLAFGATLSLTQAGCRT